MDTDHRDTILSARGGECGVPFCAEMWETPSAVSFLPCCHAVCLNCETKHASRLADAASLRRMELPCPTCRTPYVAFNEGPILAMMEALQRSGADIFDDRRVPSFSIPFDPATTTSRDGSGGREEGTDHGDASDGLTDRLVRAGFIESDANPRENSTEIVDRGNENGVAPDGGLVDVPLDSPCENCALEDLRCNRARPCFNCSAMGCVCN